MAVFRHLEVSEQYNRLDWCLLQNGSVTLYLRPEFLAEDAAWLEAQGYRVDAFDCSAWTSERLMHEALSEGLDFPNYYGRNLDAFNDCLGRLEVPEESGRVLIFRRYDLFAARFPRVAWPVLDILECQSRFLLLFGRRLLTLVQSDDPETSFEPVGARPVMWNRREWLNQNRGL